MRLLLPIFLLLVLTLPNLAFAEIKTITHTVQQPFGGSQSPDDARTAGIARAKREALERFGTYIESRTVVKDAQVDSDEILALTAGVTKAEVLKQKNYTDGDGFGLEITVKVELDTAVLDKSLKRLLQDRNHLKDLTAARVREKELLARIAELEKENKQQGMSAKQTAQLKKEFQKTRDGLTAVEWLNKAVALWDKNKISNHKKALEYLTKAIQLDPSYAAAYYSRGVTYNDLEQYHKAISDYTQAIQLDPRYTFAYSVRGDAYRHLEEYEQAIEDYTQAIKFNPGDAFAYFYRGISYRHLDHHQQAIDDYTQSIKIDPGYALAYYNRGLTYISLSNALQGCNDLKTACLRGMCDGYDVQRTKRVCK